MKKSIIICILFFGALLPAIAQEGFIGEVKLFAGNFAPRGWALCQGQLLSISSNSALFSVLGTTYGGDGRTTFALPDLRGRVAEGVGTPPKGRQTRLGEKKNQKAITQLPNQTKSTKKAVHRSLGVNYIICLTGTYPSRS